VFDGTLRATAADGLTPIALGTDAARETEGVVASWMQRHGAHAALVRPDHYVYGTAASDAELDALLGDWRGALR